MAEWVAGSYAVALLLLFLSAGYLALLRREQPDREAAFNVFRLMIRLLITVVGLFILLAKLHGLK